MRREFVSKIILGIMISTTLSTLVPVRAYAEWGNDYQNNWYYTQNNEKMTGWKKIDENLYYFDDKGIMQTGWIKAGNSWYFLQSNGVLKTGWIKYNNNLYYADSSGAMQVGTINVAGKIYVLGDNGVVKTSNTIIDGQFYTIGLDGEVVGSKVPTSDREFDSYGKILTVLSNTNTNVTISPTDSKFNEVIEDQSKSDDDPNEGRKFKVNFKDSNGTQLKTESVKNGKSVDLYTPTKTGYNFATWNTKVDGSGKSYDESDSIKVKEDIDLYAQWSDDTAIYIDGITVKGSSNVVINKTTVMTADISPSDASSTSVTWSAIDGTGKATIDSNGVLTGISNGTVTVKATSNDGSKISGMKLVTVSATEVVVPVSQITVTSNVPAITANGGTLQMEANVLPTDANNQEITWSIENKTGSANIDSSTGLVTAVSNGTVTIKATAKDGSGVIGSTTITISGQLLKVAVGSIIISGKNDATAIATDGTTLQMTASILPTTASNKAVTWSVDDTTKAIISSTGILTPLANGIVTVKAMAKDGSGIIGTKAITISKQSIKVKEISISGADISTNIGTSQMSVSVLPVNASIQNVTWSIENETGSATIDSTGKLTAISNGTVIVKATAKDGSGISGSKTVTLSNQSTTIPVASIVVTGTNNVSYITTDDGTLQMIANVLPTTTTSQAVTWSVSSSGSGTATISDTGLLKAVTNGSVTVKATSVSNSKITGIKTINLSGQTIQVDSISVSSDNNISQVEVDGTLQMSATVSPANATNKAVTWTVDSVTGVTGGTAIITSAGVLTGKSAGYVNAIATATDSSEITGIKKIQIIPQVKVTDIGVKGFPITNGTIGTPETTQITTDKGTVQMSATATSTQGVVTNQAVTWSVEKVGDTGNATIDSSTGILTATENGTVKVKATAKDGSGIVGSEVITISGQIVNVTEITVTAIDGTTKTIIVDKGTLQMIDTITPTNATNPPAVIWSVEKVGDAGTTMTGNATIDSSTGNVILTAVANGTVTVKATAADGSGFVGKQLITISGQIVKATGITINQPSTPIVAGTPIKLTATITPTTVTSKIVKWEIVSETGTGVGTAAIGIDDGVLIGKTSGVIEVKASAIDESGMVIATTTTPMAIKAQS